MPVFRFRVAWEEDENIYRDIELISGQSFRDFNDVILQSFDFKETNHAADFYESNEKWTKERAISSEVASNKKGADKLSMDKTPVPALIDHPDKKFIYIFDPAKEWTFLISLIGVEKEESFKIKYPHIAKVEGIAPLQTGVVGMPTEKLLEIEEKYDLNADEEGYGDEGEEQEDDFGMEEGGEEDL